jgi:CheY-like chemotaxis protein
LRPGLSIVHTLVSQSRGRVRIEKPGRGTRFGSLAPALVETRELPLAEPLQPETGSETILLVEDQAGLRAGLGRILASAGYRVLEAADGEQALEVVTGAARRCSSCHRRRDASHGRLCSRRGSPQYVRVCPSSRVGSAPPPVPAGRVLPAGASVLEKPFSAVDLRRQVRQLLDARSAHASG